MIASLPMYDRPETRDAYVRLWHGIRNRMRSLGHDVPDDLIHDGDIWGHWLSPDLVFSQTCGLPYRDRLHGRVGLIGTPDYGLPGCPPGHYNSVFVLRRDDRRTDPAAWPALKLAINGPDSQSGWGAPQNFLMERGGAFTDILVTGSHAASSQAVAEGRADIAAIDAQTWRMLQRWSPFAAELQEVCRTEPTPGLPYITAMPEMLAALTAAASGAIAEMTDKDRTLTDIHGFVDIPAEDYLAVPTPAGP